MNYLGKKPEQEKSKAQKPAQLSYPLRAGCYLPVHPPPTRGGSISQAKGRVPGNSRSFAISKLPHDKHTHFARTSAVCLISVFHSELEEKALSLDNSENGKAWSKGKRWLLFLDLTLRGHQMEDMVEHSL